MTEVASAPYQYAQSGCWGRVVDDHFDIALIIAWLTLLVREMSDAAVGLQAKYPQIISLQTLFSMLGWGLALWKWWESREGRLFKSFEAMIERNEAALVKASSDLVEVIRRPGPGIAIDAPVFIEPALRRVLTRRRWQLDRIWRVGPTVDDRLTATLATCDRKVVAHLARLSLYRAQIASTHLIQAAIASVRAAQASKLHDVQRFDQEALDHIRDVFAIPGHKDSVIAHELAAQQLSRLEGQQGLAAKSYNTLIELLQTKEPSPSRNIGLARAKRGLAILVYPTSPTQAQAHLEEAIDLLTEFGPLRDREFLELAQTVHLDGIARLRLNMVNRGPQQLGLAEGHYRSLLRHLESRKRGLFWWIVQERRSAGHRLRELEECARNALHEVDRLLKMNNRHQSLLIKSLRKGHGVQRQSRMRAH